MEQEPDWALCTREILLTKLGGTEPSESYILLLHNTTVIKNYFYLFSSLCLKIESERFLILKKNSEKKLL